MKNADKRLTLTLLPEALARASSEDGWDLSAYSHLDDDAAAELARLDESLILDGLVEISEHAALTLARYEGLRLSLGGLRELPVGVAAALAERDGILALNGLSSLSLPSATALAKQRGALQLNGLTELPPAVAAVLATHQPSEYFYFHDLSLDGLVTLSDDAASALAPYAGTLSLDGVAALSINAAAALARRSGTLRLPGLTSLSDATLAALTEHVGGLSLDGLTWLSDVAAAILAMHQGDLSLDGLTVLSDTAAEALARHQGDLSLNGLTALDATVAAALATHQGSLTLGGLTDLPVRAMVSLAAHPGTLRGSEMMRELSYNRPSAASSTRAHTDAWYMSPEGRLSKDNCSAWDACILAAYVRQFRASPRHDQVAAADSLAVRLCNASGFTGLTYGMQPWAPAYRCQMLAVVVRWLVDLGEKARAETLLCEPAWGFGAPAWQDVSWVVMAMRHWLNAYRYLFGADAGSPVAFAREQSWWPRHLATLQKEHDYPECVDEHEA